MHASAFHTDSLYVRMRGLIGTRYHYLGRNWVLVDVLREEGKLVLSGDGQGSPIQTDQYGQPLRRGPETLLVPISGTDPDSLSDELMDLLAARRIGTSG